MKFTRMVNACHGLFKKIITSICNGILLEEYKLTRKMTDSIARFNALKVKL